MADEPAAALAALRSMFTHPEAGLEVRTAMSGQQQQVAALMPGGDAVLRAGLIGALTIGDLDTTQGWVVRGIEIRGRAEAIADAEPPAPGYSREIIRIHPERILSWGLGDSLSRRNVASGVS